MQHSHRGRTTRRNVAAILTPLVATAGLTGISSPATAAISVGSGMSVFPNRDMVVAEGYELGDQLTVEVVRNGVVIGTTTGPAAAIPGTIGLEVNHGPLGTPQPGDCWTNYTPDIVGGDTVRVTVVRDGVEMGVDSTVVADVDFADHATGAYRGQDATGNLTNEVKVDLKGTNAGQAAVEFRRDKPDPRFRRGPFTPVFDAVKGLHTATFRPSTAISEEGLSTTEQRDIALNEAAWLAVVTSGSEVTLAELGEPGGVGPGCNGSDDPNAIAGGYTEPINVTSGDIVLSGTARAGVGVVSIKVGALPAKDITLSTASTGVQTWSVGFTKEELSTLPDGNVIVTSMFDTLPGANRTILKDTVAPAAPTETPAAGTYATAQSVALNKPTGEAASKVVYEIRSPGQALPDPEAGSTPYTPGSPIAVTSTQTIKARLIDAAGNLGAVGTFAYTIGTPPGDTTLSGRWTGTQASLTWTASTGATGYIVFRDGTRVATLGSGTRAFTEAGLAPGTYSYQVRAYKTEEPNFTASNSVSVNVPAPDTQAPTAPSLSGSVTGTTTTLNWTAATDNVGVTGYQVFRNGTQVGTTAPTVRTFSQSNLAAGTYSYTVRAVDAAGNTATSTAASLTVQSAVVAPGAPTIGTAVRGDARATVNWTAPTSNGGATITEYRIQVRNSAGTVLRTVLGVPGTASSSVVTGLTNGTVYDFRVRAVNSANLVGALSTASNQVTPAAAATVPGAPTIGTAAAGVTTDTRISATARWAAPTNNGGSAITGYVVRWQRMNGTTVVASGTVNAAATATTLSPTLPVGGSYRFAVRAVNAVGAGTFSANSGIVTAR